MVKRWGAVRGGCTTEFLIATQDGWCARAGWPLKVCG